MKAVDHDYICMVSTAEETEIARSLSVALLSHDGACPPSLRPLRPRVTCNLFAVLATDDVVVCHSDAPAADVVGLYRNLEKDMPAVLVAARCFEERDVITAFEHGATGYLVLPETPEACLARAAIITARGGSCLSPVVATTLLRHARRATFAASRESVQTDSLTPRERQIMELLVAGHTIAEVADHLTLTGKTVRNRLTSIYAKLQVRGQSGAILRWIGDQPLPVAAGAGNR